MIRDHNDPLQNEFAPKNDLVPNRQRLRKRAMGPYCIKTVC